MIDHDRLFKQLLTHFFPDFIRVFLPSVSTYLDEESIEFLEKEIFSDIAKGERYHADLVVKALYKNSNTFFLVHIESQSTYSPDFAKRMFRYFCRLYEKYDLQVYPVAILSFAEPHTKQTSTHELSFPDLAVLRFEYKVLQLNTSITRSTWSIQILCL